MKTRLVLPWLTAGMVLVAGCGGSSTPMVAQDAGGGGTGTASTSAWTTLGTRAASSRPEQTISSNADAQWSDYDPPAPYPGSRTTDNLNATMDDGVDISISVTRPIDAGGAYAAAPLPTIVTFTPYNKNTNNAIPLGGGINTYLVTHGYNHVVVDVRGTGRSGGTWDPFSVRETRDYPQVLDWVVRQPWCNGSLGLWGVSASATPALWAGSHPAVKAIFPIVAHGDIYRDVVFIGGQAALPFLLAWTSVVEALAIVNPSFYDQPDQYVSAVAQHLDGVGGFQIYRLTGILAQQPDTVGDNSYWAAKAPLEVSPTIHAPAFIIGGLYDIFQRAEPLNYEALKQRADTKLLIGPWQHLEAATGAGLPAQGIPVFDHIALRWFDHYLKNLDNGAERLPNVTQWVWGQEQYATSSDWPHPQAHAQRVYLQPGHGLDGQAPAAGAAPTTVVQTPLSTVCSESTLRIAIGITGYAPLPCWYDDNLANTLEATFDSAPLPDDLYINGPLQADLWISTTTQNAGVIVRVSDLGPDGSAKALSSGLLTASLRAVDQSRSRTLDGEMIQPWHPFTADSVLAVGPGNIVKLPVEIFPTSALIRKGHRLRISVGSSDAPGMLMPLPDLLQSAAGLLSVYNDAAHPSSVVLPVVPVSALRIQQ
jgi:putative CocE/NonD family hydrolase